jgi:uncharacterized protein (TIGR03435 family)
MNTSRVPPSSLVLFVIVALSVAVFPRSRVHAETDREPAFEVTSVTPNTSGALAVGGPADRFSNGQFHITNVPLRLLIRQLFQVQEQELIGGPAWLDTARWDISGRTTSESAALLPMIRSLLRDRFQLETHFEKRELPVYTLALARTDGSLGPTIRPTTEPPNFRQGIGTLAGRAPVNVIVSVLAFATQRHVVDRTGLHGTYDVNLHWQPTNLPPNVTPDVPNSPPIFTAVQEQLGLKLESTTAPVDVLVIDRVEKPAAD